MKYVNLYRVIRSNGSVTITPVPNDTQPIGTRLVATPGYVLEKNGTLYGNSFDILSIDEDLSLWKEVKMTP